jgi:enediyne polyketide synthase
VVASAPEDLAARLDAVCRDLDAGVQRRLDRRGGVFLDVTGGPPPRVGLLFPGQGVAVPPEGGAFARRFAECAGLFPLPAGQGPSTALAQPAIVAASLAGWRVLRRLGLEGEAALGHSLGELVACAWGGACDEESLCRIVRARGAAMDRVDGPAGGMASVALDGAAAQALIGELPLVVAALNGPARTVVSGPLAAIEALEMRAAARGVNATRLAVAHAFHSPLMAGAVPVLERAIAREPLGPLRAGVLSTVTGGPLPAEEDLPRLFLRQLGAPVRFLEAARRMEADLVIEVGPGDVFGRLFSECTGRPVVSLDVGGESLSGLLSAVGAAWALGAPLRLGRLFEDRFTRPFDLDWRPSFLASPCESIECMEGAAGAADVPPRAEAVGAEAPAPIVPHATLAPEVPVAPLAPPASPGCEPPHAASPLDLLRTLVAERAELPAAAVHEGDRFLSDLHLNSITVGQLIGETARRMGLTPPAAISNFADATLAETALALEERRRLEPAAAQAEPAVPAGVGPWVRAYVIEGEQRPCPAPAAPPGPGEWTMLGAQAHLDVALLARTLARAAPGGGVLLSLPQEVDERHIDLLLEAGRAALHRAPRCTFLLLQPGGGAASFARSLHMEGRGLRSRVIDAPAAHPRLIEWVAAEAAAAGAHLEARYDQEGRRFEPVAHLLPPGKPAGSPALRATDVLLVSGGGKGIAAECALALARDSGAALVVVGRSDPGRDDELAANLKRLRDEGVRFAYVAADVTDAEGLARGVAAAQARLGPVTAVLHAAGTNVPQLIGALDKVAVWRTLSPKTAGLRNVLAAVDPRSLRLLVTFGSIIARIGLDGEADYALANEWQTRLTEEFGRANPHCRCLAVEWSVWSGVGMGQRLGRVEALLAKGVAPIDPQSGVAMLRQLLARDLPRTAVIVSGRFGLPPTLRLAGDDVPLWRFLERPRVHYPGVELVVDAEMTTVTDPYVTEHALGGEPLVPAVVGMEAMAQAAMAVSGRSAAPCFAELELTRPLVVPRQGALRLRLAALRREGDRVEVALRCEQTDFAVDHFRAVCHWDRETSEPLDDPAEGPDAACAALDPVRDLYEAGLLFHRGRFRVLRRYRRLSARRCVADAASQGAGPWFAHYLPRDLALGDPALRDGAIHAIQACIPHQRLLPVGVESVRTGPLPRGGVVVVHARERERRGAIFVYDVEIRGPAGAVLESWRGLRLKAVEALPAPATWPEALLAAYVERRAQDVVPGAMRGLALAVNGPLGRPARSDEAIAQAMGAPVCVTRRSDGRPLLQGADAPWVSVAHSGPLTLAIVGAGPLGCDLQAVEPRGEPAWAGLLPGRRLDLARAVAGAAGEPLDCAATRVWSALECLVKAQVAADAPLVLEQASRDGWVVLGSGRLRVLTYGAPLRGREHPLVVAIAGHAEVA